MDASSLEFSVRVKVVDASVMQPVAEYVEI